MAFLKLESENKNLSWVLEKNPATGMVVKSLKKGLLFGYFPLVDVLDGENPGKTTKMINEQQYCIFFKDSPEEISYKEHVDQSFEYLSTAKYTNARFINDAIEELMRSARENVHTYLSNGEDYDIPSLHTLTVNLCETQFKTIDIFRRYFIFIQITSEEIVKNNFKLTFKVEKPCTLSYFLNYVNLFGIFAALNSNDFIFLGQELIVKYLRVLNKMDAPYFIRYLFKVRLLRSEKKFNEMKTDLENTNLYKNLVFTPGDTHDARIEWIKSVLLTDLPIVDIGVGIDCKYLKIFASKLNDRNIPYYAIEKDYDARERIKAVSKTRGLDNVELFESLELFLEIYNNKKVNVLCTEVLEHNELEEAKGILNNVIKNIKFVSFIITVPNKAFNMYYGIDGFRHNDHKWEMNKYEFQDYMISYMIAGKYTELSLFWNNIGDSIDDISVSTGLIIKNNENIS